MKFNLIKSTSFLESDYPIQITTHLSFSLSYLLLNPALPQKEIRFQIDCSLHIFAFTTSFQKHKIDRATNDHESILDLNNSMKELQIHSQNKKVQKLSLRHYFFKRYTFFYPFTPKGA